MKSDRKSTICLTVLLSSVFASGYAHSHESPPAEASPNESNAAKPAAETATDATSDAEIGEVIVTARRVEERLQDVPISITVFNQNQLSDKNVLSGRDLAIYTPSLAVNGRYGTENASFSLRGFSQELRTAPSVAMYFADVVAPRGGGAGTPSGDGAGPGSFFDLQNVQVLKGPQGTLFGRNTTGGAVLLVPQKPTSKFEGFVEEMIGNYGALRRQGVINIPVSDNLRLRAGVDYNRRDGYIKNRSGVGPSEFSDVDYTAVRLSAVWDVAENIENYTIGAYSLSDTNGQVPRLFDCNRTSSSAALACAQLDAATAAGKVGRFDVQSDMSDPLSRNERLQLINTTTWNASDSVTVKNIISYAELENDLTGDIFGTNYSVNGTPLFNSVSRKPPGLHSTDQSTFTEELQFQGIAQDGRLTWQVGGYLESSGGIDDAGSAAPSNIHCDDIDALNCYDVLAESRGINTIGNVNWQVGQIEYRNIGIYAQSSYNLTDELKATAGIRYTKDHAESDNEIALRRFPGPTATHPEWDYRTPVVYCANPDSGHGFTEIVASVNDCRVQYKKDSDAPTWVLGLDYKIDPDVMLYGKYSRGYRQGSVSPYSASGLNTYDPEKLDAYELGLKSSFANPIRGTFNVAAFYNDFTDQQLSYGFTSSKGAPASSGIINAGQSRIYGTEVDLTLIPVRSVRLLVSYAYLNTKVEKLESPTFDPNALYDQPRPQTFAGDPLPYSTKHKAAANAEYTLPLDAAVGIVSVSATYTYQSGQFIASQTVNPKYGTLPAYSLVNANLNWRAILGSNFDAGLFVTNLLDEEYRSGITNSWSSFGFEAEVPGEPRMYGGRIRYNF
jgi:iron complex outermembrane receptor protein